MKILKSIVMLPFSPFIILAGIMEDDLMGYMEFYYPIIKGK